MKGTGKPPWPVLCAYQWLAGLCDVTTGLWLIAAPAHALTWMGVKDLPESMEFVSWIGVFVLSVGLSYWTSTRAPFSTVDTARWKSVWLLTAISRTWVALFVGWEVLAGRLEAAWLTVCLTDACLGSFQWYGLKRGWLDWDTIRIRRIRSSSTRNGTELRRIAKEEPK